MFLTFLKLQSTENPRWFKVFAFLKVITPQKVFNQQFSRFLLIFLTANYAQHWPALLRRNCNTARSQQNIRYLSQRSGVWRQNSPVTGDWKSCNLLNEADNSWVGAVNHQPAASHISNSGHILDLLDLSLVLFLYPFDSFMSLFAIKCM